MGGILKCIIQLNSVSALDNDDDPSSKPGPVQVAETCDGPNGKGKLFTARRGQIGTANAPCGSVESGASVYRAIGLIFILLLVGLKIPLPAHPDKESLRLPDPQS